MDPQMKFFGEAMRGASDAYRMSPEQLVEKWSQIDPAGYADPRMTPRKKFIAACLQENMERSMLGQTADGGRWGMDAQCYELFRKEGMTAEHRALREAVRAASKDASVQALVEAAQRRVAEATVASAVPAIAVQMLPLITRAIASNPVFDLVVTIPMQGPSANIIYEDTLFDSTGETYGSGQRVDLNDDPTYSDRNDCQAAANEIREFFQRETMTATEKVLAAQICLSAEQDAQAQFGVSIEERLRGRIYQLMLREWGRLVMDDLRVMAGNTTSWSQTAPAPYSSLNTNEWRKVLAETCVVGDAMVREDVYEGTTWMVTTPTTFALLERILRFEARNTMQTQQPTRLSQVTGEFGDKYDRWTVYQDHFFASSRILLGLTTFTVAEHAGQGAYYFGAYQMADNVSMLFQPRTQVIELGGQTRAARKMIEPNAYCLISIT